MEKWRDIPGFEGRYQVSTAGRVRSLDRGVVYGGRRPHTRAYKGRMLRPRTNNHGYLCVSLGRNNTWYVQRLVLLAFIGPAPKDHETLHKNDEPADNRLSNLKYGTHSENIKMSYESGKRFAYKVAVIGTRIKDGVQVQFMSLTAAACELSPSKTGASNIQRCCQRHSKVTYGHTWRYA